MIVVLGIAGSGKSVQSKMLAQRYGLKWFSVGQFLREHESNQELMVMNSGLMLPDESVVEQILPTLQQDNIQEVILDGFPRTKYQVDWLINSHNAQIFNIRLVIIIELNPEEAYARLTNRRRPDDTVQSIKRRISTYNQDIDYIKDKFKKSNLTVSIVDGSRSIEDVQASMQLELENL